MNGKLYVAPVGSTTLPEKWTELGYVDPDSITVTDDGGYTFDVGQPIVVTSPPSVTFTLEQVDRDALDKALFGDDYEAIRKLVAAGYSYTEGVTASGHRYRRIVKEDANPST